MRWQNYTSGDGISHSDDDTGCVYCVGAGQVNFVASVGAPDIGSSYFCLPGMWWGHAPLMGSRRIGSAVAAADSICGAVPIPLLKARLRSHPEDWKAVAFALSGMFAHAAGAHADLLIAESDRRVAATLLRMGGRRHYIFPSVLPQSFACTQDQLAGAAALSRNTTGKVLRGLEADGLLEARYGRITILDAERLTQLADRA
jgi:CRP-like cAMP-binding protein